MDVLIAGAGIGGLALAGGLLADGHTVRVLEAAARPRTDGAAVTIFSNGHAAVAGIAEPLPPLGGDITAMRFVRDDGRPLARLDLTVMTERTGHRVATIPRAALVGELAGRLPDGVLVLDRTVGNVYAGDDAVTVVDATGGTHRADVLVGADGQGSVVRRATIDPRSAALSGWTTWQGLTPVLPELAGGTEGLCIVGAAGLVGLMPAGGGLLQWWFDARTGGSTTAEVEVLARLQRDFAGYAEPVPALLDQIHAPDLGTFPHVVHTVHEQWGTGASTLLGDAAHAFPPSQAQGANQALEDAWVLTRALRGTGTAAERLRHYEHARYRRMRRLSRRAASEVTNVPPSALAGAITRRLPPRVAGRGWLSAIRRWSNVLNDAGP